MGKMNEEYEYIYWDRENSLVKKSYLPPSWTKKEGHVHPVEKEWEYLYYQNKKYPLHPSSPTQTGDSFLDPGDVSDHLKK